MQTRHEKDSNNRIVDYFSESETNLNAFTEKEDIILPDTDENYSVVRWSKKGPTQQKLCIQCIMCAKLIQKRKRQLETSISARSRRKPVDSRMKNLLASNLECDRCDYTSKERAKLQRHIDTVHQNIRRFKCEKCGTAFGRNETDIRSLSSPNRSSK